MSNPNLHPDPNPNPNQWRAWFYLGFIASSQLFVLYALLCVFPIVVKSKATPPRPLPAPFLSAPPSPAPGP